jgi:translation initiation factor 2B subunit (eIF-2B alpha/beta/delta family)
MTTISPRISQAIESISRDRTHGAGWLARDAANVLTHSLEECPAQTTAELLSHLREVARALAQAQPSMAAVSNAVGAVVLAAGEKAPGGLPAMRRAALARARQIIDSWDKATHRIVHRAERVLPPGAIMTHSYSATTFAVLERLASKGSPIIVTESAPLNEGRTTARLLARLSVAVTLISDAQAAVFMPQAAAVLVGADTVFANGAVVNKVGTCALALLARNARIPFYVATETLKVAPSRPGATQEALEERQPGLAIPAVYFDLTPPRLVTALITEEGVFAPKEIRPLARRAGQYRKALLA